MFGEPTNRNRAWRILFDPEKVFWNCIYTFKELTEIFLVPHGSPLRVSPLIFLTATEKEIKVHSKMLEDLSPSEAYHLNKFMEQRPSKGFYDLSSNPDHRRRTETSDGALMTLTTNTHIWLLTCRLQNVLSLEAGLGAFWNCQVIWEHGPTQGLVRRNACSRQRKCWLRWGTPVEQRWPINFRLMLD